MTDAETTTEAFANTSPSDADDLPDGVTDRQHDLPRHAGRSGSTSATPLKFTPEQAQID
jgi:hypothetical protein